MEEARKVLKSDSGLPIGHVGVKYGSARDSMSEVQVKKSAKPPQNFRRGPSSIDRPRGGVLPLVERRV